MPPVHVMQTLATSSTGHETIAPRKDTTRSTVHLVQMFRVGARPDDPDDEVRGAEHERDDDQLTDTDSVAEHPSQRVEHGTPHPAYTLDYVNDHSFTGDGFDNIWQLKSGSYVCVNSVRVIAMARSRPDR